MEIFKFFREKRYFRFILFISLVFIITTFRSCDTTIVHGFPIVHLETEDNMHVKTFNEVNLGINLLITAILFLIIEKVRGLISERNLKFFDISLFSVLSYLIIVFSLKLLLSFVNIEESRGFAVWMPIFIAILPFIYSGGIFEGFYENYLIKTKGFDWYFENRNVPFLKEFYPNNEDFFFRLGILVFSILFFFLIYFSLKLYRYYKIKKRKN